ncbi:MAG: hypothetical protein KF855_17035, partial [Acidobacteria bacterium]|nr:hypothetical protein [Acidobacteriota bacterium]
SLNRITDATENVTPHGGSSAPSWTQVFTYDRYGNRNFDEAQTTTLVKNCGSSPNFTVCSADAKVFNPEILTANNRLKADQDGDSINDYLYDSSGNTTRDARSRKFTYDAENKQVKVETIDGSGNPIATIGEYSYDGDGRRVKKVVPSTGEVTIFVYNGNGQLTAEYSTTQPTTPKVSYSTADFLASPRILTDENGEIISRRDFHPFGEEIATAERLSELGYLPDDVRRKFTTYERDFETDLDFAQARMYEKNLGRFTVPDPLQSSGRLESPQTWNRFIYVLGNPLRYTDSLGLYEWDETAGGDLSDEELLARGSDSSLAKKERKLARKQLKFRIRFREHLAEARTLASNSALFDNESHQATVSESVNSYGTENDGNNVRIAIGASRGASARLDQEAGLVIATFRENSKGKNLVREIAHEGRHVADAREYWSEGTPTGSLDRTHFDRERRAYFVSSYVAQAQGLSMYSKSSSLAPGDKYRIWNRGWKAAEREEKRSRGINNYIQRHYGYTEDDQGTTYSEDRLLRQRRMGQ